MLSKKKLNANRANAAMSTGPQTTTGKQYSSHNSFKHGFYSRELPLSDTEQVEFDAFIRELKHELLPTGTLERLALREIARCSWRCGIALRLETRSTESILEQTKQTEADLSADVAKPKAWYCSSLQELRVTRAWLKEVLLDYSENHVLRDEWKSDFDTLFGPRFFQSLTECNAMSIDAITLANMLAAKTKAYGMKIPGFEEYKASPHMVDPMQNEQHKQKLLEFQLCHVEEFLSTWRQRVDSPMGTVRSADFCPRYFASAVRDLHRAVRWYWTVKAKKKSR